MSNPLGRPRNSLSDTEIVFLYQQGVSETQVAARLGVSRGSVRRRLLDHGVGIRNLQEACLLQKKTCVLSDEALSLVDGLMLGDGWLECTPRGSGRLGLEQRGDRGTWLAMVTDVLNRSEVECSIGSRAPRSGWVGGRQIHQKGSLVLKTRKYDAFTDQRRRWYPEGSKRIPKDVRLDAQALAHWYWGDGATSNHGYRMVFHTDGFPEEDTRFLAARLHDLYGWDIRVQARLGRRAPQFVLALGYMKQRKELVEMIRPFCPPCFVYKLKIKETA